METLRNNYHAIMIMILIGFLLLNPFIRQVVTRFIILAGAFAALIYVVRYVAS